jgi:hypothetical protein
MNRQAVALAADSASTVTEWVDGKEQVRFFKGTNKIFELSNHHPVGVMIFGSATLQEVPWEIFVKDFRKHLADKSFNDLTGYANGLFDFIKNHHLFPDDYQAKVFKDEVRKVVFLHLFLAQNDDTVKQASTKEEKQTVFQTLLDKYYEQLKNEPLPTHFEQADVDKAIALHKPGLEDELKDMLAHFRLDLEIDLSKLAELAIIGLFKSYDRYMNSTGVVFAGFGDNDYFPGYEEYGCYGLLMGKFLFDKKSSQKIDIDTPSHIKPFATTAMINTFLTGFSPDIFSQVGQQFEAALKSLGDKIRSELKVDEIPNLDNHIRGVLNEHTDRWVKAAMAAHAWPLRRVVGSLPLDEMAELAETLIMLQSLKEKVTQPTESVGGPIDVAIITKGDGFIWTKRKHYFDPKFNTRFLVRQSKSL